MITLQRVIQTLSLLLFLLLLWLAAFPLPEWAPVDAYLRMDPLVLLGTVISTRAWVGGLGVAVLILVLTAFLGRFFCGYICPMGATLDFTDRFFGKSGTDEFDPPDAARTAETQPVPRPLPKRPMAAQYRASSWRQVKYLGLFFVLGAAALGISAVFLASPLSLITRFYALLIHPLAALIGDAALGLIRPLAVSLNWDSLAYAEMALPRFGTQWFILALFIAIFSLARFAPRFWCRHLCPSGAILALAGHKPLLRRKVSPDCTGCGACQKSCPMQAIPGDPLQTVHGECISCQTCVHVCPVQAVSFGPDKKNVSRKQPFSPGRRKALLAGLAGAGTATMTFTGLGEVRTDLLPGNIMPDQLIRPPGSLPEREFLSRCIRCGLCMRACPTNTLQPIWLQAGVIALFSPRLTPRRGPCDPDCTVCGHVCPTGAIRSLPNSEKIWAKTGTATILRHKCLAWEWDKECLVCDEVCPYDAIDLRRVSGHTIPVPFVQGHKCSGCGYCEFHCPVRASSAIIVEPMEALRLTTGSYRDFGKSIGLDLDIDDQAEPSPDPDRSLMDSDQLPPGFGP